MNTSSTLQYIAASTLFTGTPSALTHDGHGLLGSHWHVSNKLIFAAMTVLTAAAVWLHQKNKGCP